MNTHLLPLACVYLLGAWVLWPLGWYFSLAFGLLAVTSNLVFISTICACCVNFGRDSCASGYGALSARLARKGDLRDFPSCFRRYIPLVAAGWVLPLIGGAVVVYLSGPSARAIILSLTPLLIFSIVAFAVLPRSSRQSCALCGMRGSCPGARFTVSKGGGSP